MAYSRSISVSLSHLQSFECLTVLAHHPAGSTFAEIEEVKDDMSSSSALSVRHAIILTEWSEIRVENRLIANCFRLSSRRPLPHDTKWRTRR